MNNIGGFWLGPPMTLLWEGDPPCPAQNVTFQHGLPITNVLGMCLARECRKIYFCEKENLELKNLREYLLPKLMTGQINIF